MEQFLVNNKWFNEDRTADKAKIGSHFSRSEMLTRGYLRINDFGGGSCLDVIVIIIKILITVHTGIIYNIFNILFYFKMFL